MSGHFSKLDQKIEAGDFPPFEPGHVWLVGAGPGGPGLMSLLGYYALGQADVIIYDALVSEKLRALANPAATQIYAGKRGGKPSADQKDISQTLVQEAQAGKRVLRLKGGDPFMFGRGGEETNALSQNDIPFRIVPGITAGIGGLAYAGIPVTHRDTNHAVIFLTGHDEHGSVPQSVDWRAIATAAPVIVMYMAVKHLPTICEKLLEAGRSPEDGLGIVSNAASAQQQVLETSLGDFAQLQNKTDIPTPAIVVVGPVLAYRKTMNWYGKKQREYDFG